MQFKRLAPFEAGTISLVWPFGAFEKQKHMNNMRNFNAENRARDTYLENQN
jgi:hypothetical protein